MRLAHGSGVRGLGGMRAFARIEGVHIFRPLLEVPRADAGGYRCSKRADACRRSIQSTIRPMNACAGARHWPRSWQAWGSRRRGWRGWPHACGVSTLWREGADRSVLGHVRSKSTRWGSIGIDRGALCGRRRGDGHPHSGTCHRLGRRGRAPKLGGDANCWPTRSAGRGRRVDTWAAPRSRRARDRVEIFREAGQHMALKPRRLPRDRRWSGIGGSRSTPARVAADASRPARQLTRERFCSAGWDTRSMRPWPLLRRRPGDRWDGRGCWLWAPTAFRTR